MKMNMKPKTTLKVSLATLILAVFVAAAPSSLASDAGKNAKPSIVLVHGAFADGSGWRGVLPLLERDGFEAAATAKTR